MVAISAPFWFQTPRKILCQSSFLKYNLVSSLVLKAYVRERNRTCLCCRYFKYIKRCSSLDMLPERRNDHAKQRLPQWLLWAPMGIKNRASPLGGHLEQRVYTLLLLYDSNQKANMRRTQVSISHLGKDLKLPVIHSLCHPTLPHRKVNHYYLHVPEFTAGILFLASGKTHTVVFRASPKVRKLTTSMRHWRTHFRPGRNCITESILVRGWGNTIEIGLVS